MIMWIYKATGHKGSQMPAGLPWLNVCWQGKLDGGHPVLWNSLNGHQTTGDRNVSTSLQGHPVRGSGSAADTHPIPCIVCIALTVLWADPGEEGMAHKAWGHMRCQKVAVLKVNEQIRSLGCVFWRACVTRHPSVSISLLLRPVRYLLPHL